MLDDACGAQPKLLEIDASVGTLTGAQPKNGSNRCSTGAVFFKLPLGSTADKFDMLLAERIGPLPASNGLWPRARCMHEAGHKEFDNKEMDTVLQESVRR